MIVDRIALYICVTLLKTKCDIHTETLDNKSDFFYRFRISFFIVSRVIIGNACNCRKFGIFKIFATSDATDIYNNIGNGMYNSYAVSAILAIFNAISVKTNSVSQIER